LRARQRLPADMEGQLTNQDVLARSVAWESYRTSGQISDKDFSLIKRLDKAPSTAKSALLQEVRQHRCCHHVATPIPDQLAGRLQTGLTCKLMLHRACVMVVAAICI
jgi:V-ATPase subunit H